MSAYAQYLQLKAAAVTISDKDFYDEHTKLLAVLRSKTKTDDREEHAEQRKELQDAIGSKHGPIPPAWKKQAREAFHERHGLPAPGAGANELTQEEQSALGGLAVGGVAGGAVGLGLGAAATYAYLKHRPAAVIGATMHAPGAARYPHAAAHHVEELLRQRKSP